MKFKWIMASPGNYKLVDDSDERPAVKLPSKTIGVPHIGFTPSWKKYEEGMKHQDSKNQVDYTDKFMAERDHAIKTDPRAKRWEEGRKKEWANAKPEWVKKLNNAG